jgi:hypothetical protein
MFAIPLPINFFCGKTGALGPCNSDFIFGKQSNITWWDPAFLGTLGWDTLITQPLTVLLPTIIIISGIIFFFWIMIAGWGVIASAGEEASAQDKAKAKAALTYAVVGFLLIVSSYFILQIVQTITGVKFINSTI